MKRQSKNEVKKIVFPKLKEYWELMEQQGYKPIFMSVKGSQNYGLSYEGSDIDVICVVMPKKWNAKAIKDKFHVKDLVSNMDVLDIIDVKDAISFSELISKGNCSYIEMLKSEYHIGNFADVFKDINGNFPSSNVNSYRGMMLEKSNALTKEFKQNENIMKMIDLYGYDPKQHHHVVRLYTLIEAYVNHYINTNEIKPLYDNIYVENEASAEYLIRLKNGPFSKKEMVVAECENINNQVSEWVKTYPELFNTKYDGINYNEKVCDFLDDIERKKNINKQGEHMKCFYNILNSINHIEISYTDAIELLMKNSDIDKRIKNVKCNKHDNITPCTDDINMLNSCYKDFIMICNKYTSKEDKKDLEHYLSNKRYIYEYSDYEYFVFPNKSTSALIYNSNDWKEFINKYNDILINIPGFYKKHNLIENIWDWKFTSHENGIGISNSINGEIINIQIRKTIDSESKYINFSSSATSKLDRKFYAYGTKADNGTHYINNNNDNNIDFIFITEGHFKAACINEHITDIIKLYPELQINIENKFCVIGLPGLIFSKYADEVIRQYKNATIITMFDSDVCINEFNNKKPHASTAKQYNKLISVLKTKYSNDIIETFPKKEKGIDDYIHSIKLFNPKNK